MRYNVFLHKTAKKELDKTPKDSRERIIESIKKLKNKPKSKARKLTPTDLYRIRVGGHRVIYEILEDEKKIHILYVGHRDKVYDDLNKLL